MKGLRTLFKINQTTGMTYYILLIIGELANKNGKPKLNLY